MNKISKFLLTKKQQDVSELVQEVTNLSYYNLGNVGTIGNVYSDLRQVPEMLTDAVISSCLALIMETAFQTNFQQEVFWVKSKSDTITKELNLFHEENNFQQLALDLGYNLLLWGNLPFKHNFDKDMKLVGVTPVPDFTKVTPIIISSVLVGFLDETGKYHYPYEYTYAQLQYYKNLGGISRVNSFINDTEGNPVQNEFAVAPSYLSASARSWRNIQIIEDALLLNRMDQSNYYRILTVDVGASVTSKSAIKALNYYRNLFKKVRRVSYDSAGMASRGSGQQFEVIIPKVGSGVEVKDVGGAVEVKALADLDKQYQRLFASLRVQPSMIGFSSDVPNTLGDTPAVLWDSRFAKTCKAIVYSTLDAIKNIDKIYLRSRGYDVSEKDWYYGTMCTSVLDEADRADNLSKAVETYRELSEQLRNNEVEYNKNYLIEAVLGPSLSSTGLSVEDLLKVDDPEITSINSSLLNFTSRQQSLLLQQKIFTQEELTALEGENKTSKMIVSGVEKVNIDQVKSESLLIPSDTEIDITNLVIPVSTDTVQVQQRLTSSKSTRLATVSVTFPVYVTPEVLDDKAVIKYSEVEEEKYSCLDNAVVLTDGKLLLTSRKDLCRYITYYLNDINHCIVDTLWSTKKK